MDRMSAESLAVIADDIADMAQCYIDANDAKSLRNSATNLAGMIRIHVTEAEARIAALEQAILVIRKCVTGEKDGEFWSARNWLDKRKVFHDDLSGLRVVEAVCQEALKPQADARGRD